jgi:hypothetical protein
MKKNPHLYVLGFIVALLLALTFGCAGAPTSIEELDRMPQVEFEDWRDRTAAIAEEAGYAVVSGKPERLGDVEHLVVVLRVICTQTVSAEAIKSAVSDDAYAGLLRIAVLELSAVVRERLGPSSHPRLAELVCAFADALEHGAWRALEEATR